MRRRRIILVAAAIVLVALSVGVAVRWRLQRISEAKESRRARILENNKQTAKRNVKDLSRFGREWAQLDQEQRKLVEEELEADGPILQKFLDIFRR
jgi:Tfp pilus assembly protein PilN